MSSINDTPKIEKSYDNFGHGDCPSRTARWSAILSLYRFWALISDIAFDKSDDDGWIAVQFLQYHIWSCFIAFVLSIDIYVRYKKCFNYALMVNLCWKHYHMERWILKIKMKSIDISPYFWKNPNYLYSTHKFLKWQFYTEDLYIC